MTGGNNKQRIVRVVLLTALVAMVLTAGACDLIGGGEKPVIRIDDCQWDSLSLLNALAKFIIEKGYGYPVELVVNTSYEMQEALSKGDVDLRMEFWSLNHMDWYNEQIAQGNIVDLGMIFEAGSQFFIIPQWVAEQYNIKTVFDMEDHWELFADPKDPSKGVFYNCIIGWQCDEINRVKLEAYGLSRYYNIVTAGSSEALAATFVRAQTNRDAVFGYYWAPTALMGAYDWYALEEPAHANQCWEKINAAIADKSLRPIDEACAYKTSPIIKIAHVGLLANAPDLAEMLRKMMVELELLDETLAWVLENDVQNWDDAAINYLQNNEDRWKTWVTPEAFENIKQALEDASQ